MHRGLDDLGDCHPRQSVDDLIVHMGRDLEVLGQRNVLCVFFEPAPGHKAVT